MKKISRQKRMSVIGKFRRYWIKKNYDLVDITQLCELKLGISGWCNDWNCPDEQIYHIQVKYRDKWIGNFDPSNKQINFEDRFLVFVTDESFIIFMKVAVDNKEKELQQEVVEVKKKVIKKK